MLVSCWTGEVDSLVLLELLPVERLMLARDVHPQTPFPTYGACAVDLEPHTVRWDRWWRQVDVWRLAWKVWRAVVLERQEVDGLVVDFLRSHGGCSKL